MPVNYSGSPEPATSRELCLIDRDPTVLAFRPHQPLAGASGTIRVNVTEEEKYFYVLTKCKSSPNIKSYGTSRDFRVVFLPQLWCVGRARHHSTQ